MFRFIEIRGVGVRESMYFMPVVKTRYGCDSMTAILRDKFLKRVYCICVYYVTYFSSHFTFDTHRIHKKIFFPVGLLAHMVCTYHFFTSSCFISLLRFVFVLELVSLFFPVHDQFLHLLLLLHSSQEHYLRTGKLILCRFKAS